jgi:hypothetical protein
LSALDLKQVFGRELQASAAPLPLQLLTGVVRGSPFSSRVVEPATSALELPEILIDSLLRTANLVEANSLLLFPAPQDVSATLPPEDPWRS